MSYRFTLLNQDEYRVIQKMRRDRRRQERNEAERPYLYSKEKEAELLKQRDLPGELKSLKRRKVGVVSALWILSVVSGFACGRMIQKGEAPKAIACEAVSISAAVLMCFKWRSYLYKIRMKNEEIACAERGWICPQIELYRQEGKSYC